jgi:ABC-type antimicrobial peptide transport system permease subunit
MLLVAAGVALLGSGIGIALGFLLSLAINAYYQRLFDTALVFSRITPPLVITATVLSVLLGTVAGAIAAARLLSRRPLDQLGR